MIVWIRADGNEEIATGHLRRTLAIARQLRSLGVDVFFLLANDESRNVFLEITDTNREKWIYLTMGIPFGCPEDELPQLRELIRETDGGWILVDSYAASESYYASLRRFGRERETSPAEPTMRRLRTACIDDLMRFDPDVDLVINYAPDEPVLKAFYHRAGQRLLGPRYAPLREQFTGLTPRVRGEVRTVLISTGGTDPFGMADAAESIVQETGAAVRFLAPGHAPVEKVAAFMQSCDLAVSAGGTTLYELCAAGVPTIAFSMADNQAIFARKMAAAGACAYAGDVRDAAGRRTALCRIRAWLWERIGLEQRDKGVLSADAASADGRTPPWELRQTEALRMHALTDGGGARRIAEALLRA